MTAGFFWRAVYLMKMPTLPRKVGIAVDWLLDALFAEDLARVGDRETHQVRREHYVPGDVIFRQGQPSRTLYPIEQGTAIVHAEGAGQPTARLRKSEHFGLSASQLHTPLHSRTA